MADDLANRSMDTQNSWTWQAPDVNSFMRRFKGLIEYSDGGYRPDSNLAAAGWVIVAICDAEPSDASNICSPLYSIINSSDLRAVKVAEGARFLPVCKSSFEADLFAVSELIMHVDSLADSGSLPPQSLGNPTVVNA